MQRSGPRGPCICGKHCNAGNKYPVALADPGSPRKVGARDLQLPPCFWTISWLPRVEENHHPLRR